ncbi:MAG: hypothetical protein C0404_11925 [Verrucomicrobia bacterium]|nr:hypothetical protein [Verrucomicrobiota bacterium]
MIPFCVCLICVATGCLGPVVLPEGRAWPAKPAFSIMPSSNIVEYTRSGIDFDAVYVIPLKTAGGFNYLRFWPTGRLLVRPTDHPPTLIDVEDFTSAFIGYYTVNGDLIKYEVFVPAGSPPWAYGYELIENKLETNSILELRSSFNGSMADDMGKYNLRYVKQPMPGMKRQPDW